MKSFNPLSCLADQALSADAMITMRRKGLWAVALFLFLATANRIASTVHLHRGSRWSFGGAPWLLAVIWVPAGTKNCRLVGFVRGNSIWKSHRGTATPPAPWPPPRRCTHTAWDLCIIFTGLCGGFSLLSDTSLVSLLGRPKCFNFF